MGVQEQAFRTYYASMSDAKLLETAAHRSSFIEAAQRVLDEEFSRRHLALPAKPLEHSGSGPGGGTLRTWALRVRASLFR
jgi:hypothetical protein